MSRAIQAIVFATPRPLLATRVRNILAYAGFSCEPEIVRPDRLALAIAGKRDCLVMIDGDGKIFWKAIEKSIECAPDSMFVVCCDSITPDLVHAAIDSGLHGLISTKAGVAEAAQAVMQVCQGERRMCFDGAASTRQDSALTPSERRVLPLAARGYKNAEIAEELGISEASVKVHLHHVRRKTGAKDRQDLIKAAEFESIQDQLEVQRAGAAASASLAQSFEEVHQFDSTWMFGELRDKVGPIQEEI